MATPDEKYELITRRVQEILGGDSIKAILADGRAPKCYWGTAPTGRPHIGYFVPLVKIADFLRAGVEVRDVHAFLDNLKAPLELVAHRTKYYQFILLAVFKSLGIPTSKLTFVEGSSYQLTKEYNLDNYKLCATVSEHDAKKAGAEVVKQVESPLLSGLLYPGLQALDEQYLGVDFQFGGVDQRKIFTFAELYLPRLGYAKRAHLMNAMVPGLAGGKMSSSDPNSKIDLSMHPNWSNGVLAFVEAVLIPVSQLRAERLKGDTLLEETLDQNPLLQTTPPRGPGFASKNLHPKDLKTAVANAIIRMLEPIRKSFDENEEWRKIEKLAYPDPNAKPEKKKKEKVYHPPPPGKGKNAKVDETPKPTTDAGAP
ncbi:hypothetical protein BD779DRAFT_1534665 [Infundibulicybe gibba]|nr:hypothetical protein BD779DRAFT_1534665 [Infundibulicybe gibba]